MVYFYLLQLKCLQVSVDMMIALMFMTGPAKVAENTTKQTFVTLQTALSIVFRCTECQAYTLKPSRFICFKINSRFTCAQIFFQNLSLTENNLRWPLHASSCQTVK